MSYLGLPPTSAAFVTDTFSGTGSQTDFTMSVAPASTTSMLVVVGGVLQDPANYAIVGMTLRFSTAPPAGTGNISVRYMGIPASGVVNTAYRTVTDFTATAGQTTITVPSYTVGFIDVFRNGVRLGNTDFTATSGTSIVLAVGANANDLITTVSFSVQSVLNAIPNVPRGVTTANLPVGSVLQVVQGTYNTSTSTASTTYVDSGLSATITPSSATSKILVVISAWTSVGGGTDNGMGIRIARNGAVVWTTGSLTNIYAWSAAGAIYGMNSQGMKYLDSPATTSPTTYKLQFASYNSNTVYMQYQSTVSTITLMEIAA